LSEKINLKLDSSGLVPAVIQDARTGTVLMLGFMNPEAVKLTLTTGEVWFYSRSRQEMWHKGATSGNRLIVREAAIDCDNDAVLVKAEPMGPVCHTGEANCFYRALTPDMLPD